MSAPLWLGIGHYLLGVLVIFALLAALMETSRQFDKFHDSSYLLLASGYFLLLVWSLVRAMTLTTSLLQITGVIGEVVGFICLAIGYYYHQRSHPVDDDVLETASTHMNKEPTQGWLKLLSADREPAEEEASEDTTEEDDSGLKAAESQSVDDATVSDAGVIKNDTADNEPVEEPKKPAKKRKKLEGDIDLSYLASRSQSTKRSISDPSEKTEETREEMMDELFPVKNSQPNAPTKKVEPPVDEDERLPGEVGHDQSFQVALLANGLAGGNWLTVWPELIVVVVIITLILALIPQRHQRGSAWLLAGFSVILLANLLALFLAPQLAGLMLKTDAAGYSTLLIHLIEVIGFGLVGVASWLKIKGKVTHHFLRIVSIIYLVLLVLTVGLALVIVHDQTSLQLLLLLMTGVLITILPIIHSLTYSHPYQPLNEDSQQA